MTENAFSELIAFVREQTQEFDIPITRETLIEDGLGVTGAEADELIENFAKKYNVDISNFVFANYFYNEPSMFPQYRKVKPFTVGHLEKAIIAGQLDEGVINS